MSKQALVFFRAVSPHPEQAVFQWVPHTTHNAIFTLGIFIINAYFGGMSKLAPLTIFAEASFVKFTLWQELYFLFIFWGFTQFAFAIPLFNFLADHHYFCFLTGSLLFILLSLIHI